MPIDVAKALAAEPRSTEISWDHKDVQLYHLGLGAGVPATDPAELRYTLESALHVLPSFATVAGAGMGVVGGLSSPGIDVDLAAVLHGTQSVDSHRALPVSGRATSTSRVTDVYDKGKAAILVLRTDVADEEGPLWTSEAQIFVRGEGGFGGSRGPPGASTSPTGSPISWSSGGCGRSRRCSIASPATGTRSTPTPTSPGWPDSSGRSSTGCARTEWRSRPWWTTPWRGTSRGSPRTACGLPGWCTPARRCACGCGA